MMCVACCCSCVGEESLLFLLNTRTWFSTRHILSFVELLTKLWCKSLPEVRCTRRMVTILGSTHAMCSWLPISLSLKSPYRSSNRAVHSACLTCMWRSLRYLWRGRVYIPKSLMLRATQSTSVQYLFFLNSKSVSMRIRMFLSITAYLRKVLMPLCCLLGWRECWIMEAHAVMCAWSGTQVRVMKTDYIFLFLSWKLYHSHLWIFGMLLPVLSAETRNFY